MAARKLRLGIMCMGPVLPCWQALCIERMIETGLVEIALIILDDPANYPRRSLLRKLRDIGFARLLFTLYSRTLFRPRSSAPIDLSQLFEGVPRLSCIVTAQGKYSQYFSEQDIEAIRGHDLDMILRFGFNIIRGSILHGARYGIWSFHHDDELRYRGAPPCFWEIYHGDQETGSVLQRLTDRLDGGIILKKGFFRTKSHAYVRNIDQAYFESASWPAWVCRDIVAGNAGYIDAEPTPSTAPIFRHPTNLQFLRALLRVTWAALKHAVFRLFVLQRWNVALLSLPIERLGDATQEELRAACMMLLPQKGRRSFNADGFGVRGTAGTAIFYEQLDYASGGRGQLMIAELDSAGDLLRLAAPEGLPPGTHASYPYIYSENGTVYMIPETSALDRISLFQAVDFPRKWEKVCDLLTGAPFVDATLVRHDERYWLFYTRSGDAYDPDLHLHLAFSDSLFGPFVPHSANPVKISARSARPAGTPFIDCNGDLVRPAQNFCKTYGGSVIFNRVTTLTPSAYAEVEVGELKPFHAVYKHGLHTVAAVGSDHVLVDMKRHVLRALGAWAR